MHASCLVPETAAQSGILLTWPHVHSAWADCLDSVTAVYLAIARAIVAREKLLIICYDGQHAGEIRQACMQAGMSLDAIRFFIARTNDTWIRDYGPLAVADGTGVRLLDFVFDGWGKKYPAGLDNEVTRKLEAAGVFGTTACDYSPLVLEGGSIDTDGQGNLLTTSHCLITNSRNPGYDRPAFARLFAGEMGIERVLWLDHGELEGDDTDAHIDMLARFCSPFTIAYTQCSDESDSHYAGLKAMEEQLHTFRTREERPYRLLPLPLPAPVRTTAGERLPASYANFLIINGAVLVPVYGDPADATALERLAGAFPDRQVIPINCLPLIHQFGSLHCATLQLPAGIL
jgi:agmatine/peptidylarginine deiminase